MRQETKDIWETIFMFSVLVLIIGLVVMAGVRLVKYSNKAEVTFQNCEDYKGVIENTKDINTRSHYEQKYTNCLVEEMIKECKEMREDCYGTD